MERAIVILIAVVLLLGIGTLRFIERMRASGFDGYMAKPVSTSDVREQMRPMLHSAS